MKPENFIFEEAELSGLLKNEILKDVQETIEVQPKSDLSSFEYISKAKINKTPIMGMDVEELLQYIESHEVAELEKLSNAELNYMGKVLGICPEMLI